MILALSQWSGTEPAISPRYIGLYCVPMTLLINRLITKDNNVTVCTCFPVYLGNGHADNGKECFHMITVKTGSTETT